MWKNKYRCTFVRIGHKPYRSIMSVLLPARITFPTTLNILDVGHFSRCQQTKYCFSSGLLVKGTRLLARATVFHKMKKPMGNVKIFHKP